MTNERNPSKPTRESSASPQDATTDEFSKGSLPGRKVELNGVNYHVADIGSGDRVVLLLHGMPDISGVWRHQVAALVREGYRVIVPDMLGYGKTDKPAETARYAGEIILEDIVSLLNTLSIPQIDIVGHDWGGYASWEMTINYPDRFRRHVVISQGHPDWMLTPRSYEDVKANWYMYFNTQEDAGELYAANGGEWFRKFFLPSHPDVDEVWSRMQDPDAMSAMLNWDRANPMASYYLAAMRGQSLERRCSVPTLGIWSADDTYLWEAQIQESAKLMDAPWRYVRLDHGSHWPQLDNPDQVNAHMLDWLAQG